MERCKNWLKTSGSFFEGSGLDTFVCISKPDPVNLGTETSVKIMSSYLKMLETVQVKMRNKSFMIRNVTLHILV